MVAGSQAIGPHAPAGGDPRGVCPLCRGLIGIGPLRGVSNIAPNSTTPGARHTMETH